LSFDIHAHRFQLEVEAFLVQLRILDRVLVDETSVVARVLRSIKVALRYHTVLPGSLLALELTLGRANLRRRKIGRLFALEHAAARFDRRAIERYDQPIQRRLLARVFAAQARTIDGCQHLTFGDGITRVDDERHCAIRRCK
jgi:hypothetical protein